jgi:hypothetical protein
MDRTCIASYIGWDCATKYRYHRCIRLSCRRGNLNVVWNLCDCSRRGLCPNMSGRRRYNTCHRDASCRPGGPVSRSHMPGLLQEPEATLFLHNGYRAHHSSNPVLRLLKRLYLRLSNMCLLVRVDWNLHFFVQIIYGRCDC